MTNYEKQGEDFLKKYGIEFEAIFSHKGNHFERETEERNIWNIIFKKGDKKLKIVFGDSLNNTKKRDKALKSPYYYGFGSNNSMSKTQKIKILKETTPSAYDILSCLQINPVGDIVDFMLEYGYEVKNPKDLRRIQKIHLNCLEEYEKVSNFFTYEELEDIAEIY